MASTTSNAYEGVEMGQIESGTGQVAPETATGTETGERGSNWRWLAIAFPAGFFFVLLFLGIGFIIGWYTKPEKHSDPVVVPVYEYVTEYVCPNSVLKTTGNRDGFVDCINRAVTYPEYIVMPHSIEYYNSSQVFSKFYENYPVAVAYPNSEATVAKLVTCAATYDVKVSARCGGHGNAGNAVQTGALTIDLRGLNEVVLSADHNTVIVGAGNTAGQASYQLWQQSGRTRGIPIGQKPSVGISGLTLGGGFGFSTRKYGLLCDHIQSMRAVLSNGTAVYADKHINADLLWASCGGGGGNFAITTQFNFSTIDESRNLTVFHYYMSLDANRTAAAHDIQQYQIFSNAFDARATPNLEVLNNSMMAISGYFYGNISEFYVALAAADPSGYFTASKWELHYMDYVAAAITLSGWNSLKTVDQLNDRFLNERNYFQFKSFLLFEHLPIEAVYMLIDLVDINSDAGSGLLFEFQDFGGNASAFAQVPATSTAFPHRNALHCLMLKSWGATRDVGDYMFGLMSNVSYELSTYIVGEGAYVNHMDYELWNYQRSYYGVNQTGVAWNSTIVKLQEVNAKYDPGNLMAGIQLF